MAGANDPQVYKSHLPNCDTKWERKEVFFMEMMGDIVIRTFLENSVCAHRGHWEVVWKLLLI